MLLAAGILALLLAIAHSALGERLVFARLREGRRWTQEALAVLEARRWRALRATWHLVSIFGVGLAAMLVDRAAGQDRWVLLLAGVFAVSGAYWAVATRFGHPAWIVFGALGALLVLA